MANNDRNDNLGNIDSKDGVARLIESVFGGGGGELRSIFTTVFNEAGAAEKIGNITKTIAKNAGLQNAEQIGEYSRIGARFIPFGLSFVDNQNRNRIELEKLTNIASPYLDVNNIAGLVGKAASGNELVQVALRHKGEHFKWDTIGDVFLLSGLLKEFVMHQDQINLDAHNDLSTEEKKANPFVSEGERRIGGLISVNSLIGAAPLIKPVVTRRKGQFPETTLSEIGKMMDRWATNNGYDVTFYPKPEEIVKLIQRHLKESTQKDDSDKDFQKYEGKMLDGIEAAAKRISYRMQTGAYPSGRQLPPDILIPLIGDRLIVRRDGTVATPKEVDELIEFSLDMRKGSHMAVGSYSPEEISTILTSLQGDNLIFFANMFTTDSLQFAGVSEENIRLLQEQYADKVQQIIPKIIIDMVEYARYLEETTGKGRGYQAKLEDDDFPTLQLENFELNTQEVKWFKEQYNRIVAALDKDPEANLADLFSNIKEVDFARRYILSARSFWVEAASLEGTEQAPSTIGTNFIAHKQEVKRAKEKAEEEKRAEKEEKSQNTNHSKKHNKGHDDAEEKPYGKEEAENRWSEKEDDFSAGFAEENAEEVDFDDDMNFNFDEEPETSWASRMEERDEEEVRAASR